MPDHDPHLSDAIREIASLLAAAYLRHMTVGQLRQKYIEVVSEESRSNHKQFLFRRIAWRIQAIARGRPVGTGAPPGA